MSASIAKDPKKAARDRVTYALNDGRITNPCVCSKCGKPESEAHHADYTRPLDVTWLCHTCHMALHAKLRRG